MAEARSGRTDRYGGHRDNKNKSGLGSYHYHCGGHPAHLHENGVCPYASYVEEAAPAVSPEETAAEVPENLSMVFDPIYYADHNPDLYEAFGYDTDQLQEHFLTCGMKEGRPGHDIRMNCFPSSFSEYLVFKNLIPVPKTLLGSY